METGFKKPNNICQNSNLHTNGRQTQDDQGLENILLVSHVHRGC